ncbi:MAG: CBS domain-containing protein [Pseudomonadota bacterium]|nr:CBS domain-containing protein [Pseudomonadota bacterium]
MFAVYNLNGRIYSGPLEQLRRVEASSKTKSSRRAVDNGSANEAQYQNSPDNTPQFNAFQVSRGAIARYNSMLSQKGQPEPVYHAYQIMSKGVQTLQSEWPFERADKVMAQSSYQLYPVINSAGLLRGSVSRQQYYEFKLLSADPLVDRKRSIANCLLDQNSRTFAVDPVTDVRRISSLLFEENLCALPVVQDSGEVLGIVSRTDILRCMVKNPPLSLWC